MKDKNVSVVAFEEEEHEGGSGSGNGEGHISGAVKLKTEQSISDILQFKQIRCSSSGGERRVRSIYRTYEPEVDNLVGRKSAAGKSCEQDKGSMLENSN